MANTRSAEKRNRQALKRAARNQAVRTRVKTAIRKVREAIEEKDKAKASAALSEATRTLQKAASKGVLHKGNASRHIARLAHAAAGMP
ncbi:MAG: 30S ribosomal protein S20 [Myxococcales bacterium]|nr:30S ribosomal protein S20 [Myxococcales bacterium]